MNSSACDRFRALIHDRLAALEAAEEAGAEGQQIVTLDQQAIGRLSRQDALQNQAMAQAQARRRAVEKQRLQAALLRLDEGEFGYCDDCGEEIAFKRLELDPAVQRCVECASGYVGVRRKPG